MTRPCLLLQLLFFSWTLYAQNRVEWQVTSDDAGPLVGASIITGSGQVLITDEHGLASSKVNASTLIYTVSHVGFRSVSDTVFLSQDIRLQVSMEPEEVVIAEVTVSGSKLKDQLTVAPGHVSFGMEATSDLPYLLGEQDPVKFIQTQTGVSTGTDGNNGYYVRGGGIDQNMILLDRMELYNTNHLFGFFSTFNAQAVDRVDFLKSGYPAHTGGRLSSVMKIHTIAPNAEKVSGHLGMSILAANVNLEVPVIKNKSSMLLSARKSYIDLITQNLFREGSEVQKRTDYTFSDIIWKYHHQIGKSHRVALTGFFGSDDYDYQSNRSFANIIKWNTFNLGGIWKWIISPTLDAEVYVNGGRYNQRFLTRISNYEIDLQSYIASWKAGASITWTSGAHQLTFSGEMSKRTFRPTQVQVNTGKDEFALSEAVLLPTIEGALSIDDHLDVNEKLRIAVGLRLSGFAQLGPFTRYETTENNIVSDSMVYGNGAVAAWYWNLEPRVQANYLLTSAASLKISYDRSFQYIHLSPLSSVSLPTDIWVPSSGQIRPQSAHQFTVGYFRIAEQRGLKVSAEAFFKLLNHQLEYRNGAILGYSDSKNFDDDFIFGKGRSYGMEWSLERTAGALSYQMNYTLGKTVRIFGDLNKGASFPAKYDRRHDLNLVGSYELGNWTFSGLFKLSSGNALTLPVAKYVINERVVSEYSARNSFRMPTYHRLDLAASVHPRGNEQVTWSFSVYNVYNRKNPYFIYFDVQGNVDEYSLDINLEKVSLFPVLPSVSYAYTF